MHAEMAWGQGQAHRYFLGGADRSKRHPSKLHGPPRASEQPQPRPGTADAAAWATNSCNMEGPSTSTSTAGRVPHNHPPTAPPQQPDGSLAAHNQTTSTTTDQNDRADVGSGTTGLTANQPTIRGLAPAGTDHTAIEPTARTQTHHTQTGQYGTFQTCKGQKGNGVLRTGDTMLRHARQRPHAQTQQHTTPLPLYNRPTDDNNLLQIPGPPGERKLHCVRTREYASRHARPVARDSSSRLTPTENKPRWGCLQDKASGPVPGSWAPESGGR